MKNTVNTDFLLNPLTNDLDLSGLGLNLSTDSQATAQRIQVRLQSFKGEWFLDRTKGIPYFQSILVKQPDLNLTSSILKSAIAAMPFVESFNSFDIFFSNSNRSLTITFNVNDIDSDAIGGAITV